MRSRMCEMVLALRGTCGNNQAAPNRGFKYAGGEDSSLDFFPDRRGGRRKRRYRLRPAMPGAPGLADPDVAEFQPRRAPACLERPG